MVRFKLSGAFVILLAATCCLWQFRFVRDPHQPTITLGNLRSTPLCAGASWTGTGTQPALLMQPATPAKPTILWLPLPHLPPANWLHLKFHLQAANLRVGPQPWSDGRLILEWQGLGGSREFDPISAARDNQDTGSVSLIARPEQGPATPTLRLENLGSSGDFRILTFEATVVEERASWRVGKWLLIVAWISWLATAAGLASNPNRLRPTMAAGIWLLMAINFSFPGPWKTLHPLAAPFQLGAERPPPPEPAHPAAAPTTPAATTTAPDHPPTAAKPPLASAGRIPTPGNLVVKVQDYIHHRWPFLKSLYHTPLLFAPTLLSLLLIGQRRSVWLAAFISLTIEIAQLAFGFSCDWQDLIDLLCDGIGIFLACRTYHWFLLRRTNSATR